MCKTLILQNNIKAEKYNQLIDICFDLATCFSFTKRSFHTKNSVYLKFLKDLDPSYMRTIFTKRWFAYCLYNNEHLEVCLYNADNEMKFVIKRYFDNLFQEAESMNGRNQNIKNLPEDICFFRDNKLLLGTVSHEHICFLYPPNEKIEMQFKKLGNWEETSFIADEQICLSFIKNSKYSN